MANKFEYGRWLRDWSLLGAIFGSLMFGLAYLFNTVFKESIIKLAANVLNGFLSFSLTFSTVALDLNLRNQVSQAASNPLLADFFNNLFGGLIPSSLGAYLIAAIGGVVFALVGRFLYHYLYGVIPQKWRSGSNGKTWIVIGSLFFGTLVGAGIAMWGMWTGGFALYASLILSYAIFAMLVGWLLTFVYKHVLTPVAKIREPY